MILWGQLVMRWACLPVLESPPVGDVHPPPQLGPDEEHHDLCTWLLAPWTVPLAVGAADA